MNRKNKRRVDDLMITRITIAEVPDICVYGASA
jgi:hypothetical protein